MMVSAAADASPTSPLRLRRAALIIVLAAIVGPLIGGVAVFLVMASMTAYLFLFEPLAPASLADLGRALAEMFVTILGAAYLTGGGIAAIAGILLGLWSLWRPLSFVAVIAAALLANPIFYGLFEREVFTSESSMPLNGVVVTIVFSLFAASVGWLVMRRGGAR